MDRLEALLTSVANATVSVSDSSSGPSPVTFAELGGQQQQLPPKLQTLTEDAVFLQRSLAKSYGSTPIQKVFVRTRPLGLHPQSPSHRQPVDHPACVWLPTQDETQVLVNKYTADLNYSSHIVHGPSLRRLVTEIPNNCPQVPADAVILLLSVFAFVATSWTASDAEMVKLFPSITEALAQAEAWRTTAFDILERCQRNSEISLEIVQGLTLLSLTMLGFEGITSHVTVTLARAIATSRQLGLHRLDQRDDASSGERMLATGPGLQRGTYSINLHHMAVRKPLNLDDEDIADERDLVARPMDHPTSMSYFLQRLRFAEKMKAIIDRAPLVGFDSSCIPYGQVLEMDAIIANFLRETPRFFSMDGNESGMPSYPPGVRPQNIAVQRHLLISLVHGQRCRLHLHYFARSAAEPAYEHSRRVALESARLIVDAEAKSRTAENGLAPAQFRLGTVLAGYFSAAAILVMDLCLATREDEVAIKQQQVRRIWCVLQETAAQASVIRGGVRVMEAMMKKHNVWFSAESDSSQHYAGSPGQGPMENAAPLESEPVENPMDVELDGIDWDGLSWVVDMAFL
ncbi:hypothetical protein ACJ41O_007584 [Fusarium nematophilum]